MIKRFSALAAWFFILIQAGCTTSSYIHKANNTEEWKQNRDTLEQIRQWDIRGKISIRSESDLYTADLFWTQKDAQLNMRLVAPFSQAVTEFSGSDEKGYQVLTEQGERFNVDSPETVTDNAFGVSLPFTELKSWIKGLPDRNTRVWKAKFNEQNRLESFQQSGWHVKLLKYRLVGKDWMPVKLFLSRVDHDIDDKNVDVRLIVRRWLL